MQGCICVFAEHNQRYIKLGLISLKKIIIFYLLVSWPALVFADAYVAGVKTKITTIDSYNYGSVEGDIRILVANSVPGCEAGYYVNSSNTGIDKILSIALSAFHSDANIIIGGRSGIPWSGSGNTTYCKVHAIQIVK